MATQLAIAGAEQFEKPAENGSAALLRIIERAAFDPTLDAAKLSVLLDVKLKWEADEARKAFEVAFQQFKRNLPELEKTKRVAFGSGSNHVEYDHAELNVITPIIAEALLAVGISHYWRTGEENGRTTVTCILEGHGHTREAAKLSGPPDTSGGKNSIQAIGSTKTYLERYTLLAATGIAVKGMDDDGRTEGMSASAVDEYCSTIRDSATWDELKHAFFVAYEASKKAKDDSAGATFIKVKDARKKEIEAKR